MKAIEKVKAIKLGKLTAEQNIKSFLDIISKENKKINAVLVVNENALAEAKVVDKKKSKGKLAGLGIIVKSNICVQGLETNCASKVLENWKSSYDASVIKKIKAEDGIILGMANMDEFASGASGETSAYGPCKNPKALELVPGGSSSGSAASVAAGFCDVALGSDTGGSIRNPASHCGVVGVKPSYGSVSRYGLIDLSMSLDQIGPLANNIEDAELITSIIYGKDENDPTTFDSKLDVKTPKKITIGVLNIEGDERIKDLINGKVEGVVAKMKWNKKNVNIKYIDLAIQTYYPLVYTEFFSGTRKFDGRLFGKKIEDACGPEVLRRILGGSEISKAEYEGRFYKKSLEVKQLIKEEFAKAFKNVDCIISPTVPRLPHKLGSKISVEDMYAYDTLTVPANLAEIPGISIPVGEIDGVPVGMQILCNHLGDGKMLSIAKFIESLG